MQHPIIRPLVFREQIRQPIIQHFDKRVHTLLLGYGSYPTTYEVVSLFVSAWRNTEGDSLDHPRYLPRDCERGGGCGSGPPVMVVRHIPEPILRWSALGTYDPRGWMAPTCGLDKDQWPGPLVITPDGGPWLEGSQWSSPPGNASNPSWNCYGAPFPTQDIESRIPGERNGCKVLIPY